MLLNMWHWGDGRDDGFDMAGGIMMMIFWVVLIVAVVLLAVWLIRQSQVGGAPPTVWTGGGETPLDVLAKRYARGEIDKAEYEEKKRDLSG